MMGANVQAGVRARGMSAFAVGRGEAGKPLQDFLAARLGVSRRAAKELIDARKVWVNRRCVWMARHPLAKGDSVEIPSSEASRGAKRRRATVAAKTHVRILCETGNFLVADKPAGILSAGGEGSAEEILRRQLGEPSLQAAHRLDRDTSGCLLFARSEAAFQAAVEVFKTHRVKKEYRAIVAGRFPYRHQTIDAALDGEPAVSRVTMEAAGDGASFLKVRIETGRTNQIRRHLASVRFPIVGDRTFGLKHARDARLMTVPRQMLHAASLELPDPVDKGGTIKAHSPLPADFRATLGLFGMGRR